MVCACHTLPLTSEHCTYTCHYVCDEQLLWCVILDIVNCDGIDVQCVLILRTHSLMGNTACTRATHYAHARRWWQLRARTDRTHALTVMRAFVDARTARTCLFLYAPFSWICSLNMRLSIRLYTAPRLATPPHAGADVILIVPRLCRTSCTALWQYCLHTADGGTAAPHTGTMLLLFTHAREQRTLPIIPHLYRTVSCCIRTLLHSC